MADRSMLEAEALSPIYNLDPNSILLEAMYTGQNLSTGSKKQINYFSKKSKAGEWIPVEQKGTS